MTTGFNLKTLIYVISMEFLSWSRRRSSARNVPSSEERGETDVFAGYSLPGPPLSNMAAESNFPPWDVQDVNFLPACASLGGIPVGCNVFISALEPSTVILYVTLFIYRLIFYL